MTHPETTEAIGSAISQLRWHVEPSAEEEFNRWYDEEHLADLLAQPGVLSGRRFVRAETAFSAPSTFNYITIYQLDDTSALETPYEVNNTVVARIFEPAPSSTPRPRRAVLVLPQWNADSGGHVGLCQLFARFGLTAVRLSLPYHDERRPADLSRAEFIVSSNIGRESRRASRARRSGYKLELGPLPSPVARVRSLACQIAELGKA